MQERVPTWVSPIKDENGRWISSHVINQDIIACIGQVRIADRTKENLRSSDIGIAMMRKRFFEESTPSPPVRNRPASSAPNMRKLYCI